MVETKGVEFIVDEKGRKKAVVISYKAYQELLEDIADLQSIAERRDEKSESLESVIADLKNAGRL